MKSSAAVLIAFGLTTSLAQQTGAQKPSEVPRPNVQTSHGCYSSSGELEKIPQLQYPASGSCGLAAVQASKAVFAMYAGDCYVGDTYPPKSSVVADKNCHYPCPFFPAEACGGIEGGKFFSVFNSGVKIDAQDMPDPASSSSSSSGPTATAPGETVVVTKTPSSTPNSGGGSNAAGIAAGVVVGVVVIAAIVGGVLFYLRRKRNREIEEEHRRNAAVNAFIGGAKPPSTSGGLSITDSRLDPQLNRRMSDGSIADNQDYSRKILRVTNV